MDLIKNGDEYTRTMAEGTRVLGQDPCGIPMPSSSCARTARKRQSIMQAASLAKPACRWRGRAGDVARRSRSVRAAGRRGYEHGGCRVEARRRLAQEHVGPSQRRCGERPPLRAGKAVMGRPMLLMRSVTTTVARCSAISRATAMSATRRSSPATRTRPRSTKVVADVFGTCRRDRSACPPRLRTPAEGASVMADPRNQPDPAAAAAAAGASHAGGGAPGAPPAPSPASPRGGAPPASGAGSDSWRSSLAPELRDDASIKRYSDVNALARGLVAAEARRSAARACASCAAGGRQPRT